MITRQELKQRAKAQLGGSIFSNRWLTALLVCFVVTMLLNICNMPNILVNALQNISADAGDSRTVMLVSSFGSIGALVAFLLSGPLSYGQTRMFLKQARDGQNMNFSDVFKGFSDDFGGNVLLALLIGIFTFLWALLFIIPGIVKGYAYSLSFYIKADHPEYDWKACINESKRMMQGHKGELFLLDLSFIGWYIVGAMCFGVGTFWVMAYVEAAKAHFYQTLLLSQSPAVMNEAPPAQWTPPTQWAPPANGAQPTQWAPPADGAQPTQWTPPTDGAQPTQYE